MLALTQPSAIFYLQNANGVQLVRDKSEAALSVEVSLLMITPQEQARSPPSEVGPQSSKQQQDACSSDFGATKQASSGPSEHGGSTQASKVGAHCSFMPCFHHVTDIVNPNDPALRLGSDRQRRAASAGGRFTRFMHKLHFKTTEDCSISYHDCLPACSRSQQNDFLRAAGD